MGKHTQGPWSIKRHANAVWIEAAKRQQVCDITTETPKGDELEDASDNAQLIAAAPDLLEALRPFADLLESPDEYPDDTFECFVEVADIKRAIAAIRKAKGDA